jgi:hypothetical protein
MHSILPWRQTYKSHHCHKSKSHKEKIVEYSSQMLKGYTSSLQYSDIQRPDAGCNHRIPSYRLEISSKDLRDQGVSEAIILTRTTTH